MKKYGQLIEMLSRQDSFIDPIEGELPLITIRKEHNPGMLSTFFAEELEESCRKMEINRLLESGINIFIKHRDGLRREFTCNGQPIFTYRFQILESDRYNIHFADTGIKGWDRIREQSLDDCANEIRGILEKQIEADAKRAKSCVELAATWREAKRTQKPVLECYFEGLRLALDAEFNRIFHFTA
jgi:hypothetical protein